VLRDGTFGSRTAPPAQESYTQHQQHVGQYGPHQRRLDHRREPFPQGEYGHEQLGQVSEARLQEASGAGAEVLSHLFDRLADDRRQRRDGQAGEDEAGHVVGADSHRQSGRHCEHDRADDGQALGILEGIDSAGHVGDFGRRYSGRSGDVVQ
jgi:hypothetical protein